MKKLILILVLLSSLFLMGCNKDAQVNAFMKEFEKATSEISEKFDEGDIDGAKKVVDKEKPDLRAKWLAIRNIWSFQASDAIKKKMNEEPIDNMKMVVKSSNKAINKNPAEAAKIQAIVNELTDVIK